MTALEWCVTDWCSFRGVGHAAGWVRGAEVIEVVHGDTGLDTWPADRPRIEAEPPTDATAFAVAFPLPNGVGMDDLALRARSADGAEERIEEPLQVGLRDDPYHALWARFRELLAAEGAGHLLEIGARGERADQVRAELPAGWDHTGFDVYPGPNVDIVGDAHDLRGAIGRGRTFDAAMSLSVFEHLAMPWKVVLELNAVVRTGGLVLVQTHQTFPLHEVPWDYWRFSNDAWFTLFNPATGFVIEEVAMGEPASIVPRFSHPIVAGNEHGQAYLGAGVIARRVGKTKLRWPVALDDVITNRYPSA